MSDESNPGDPLRRTLAEMREELDRLIGDEIALLNGGCEERGAAGPARAGGVGSACDRPDMSGRAEAGNEAGRRLDALALHLEGRLRRSRDRAAESRFSQEEAPPMGPARGRDAPQTWGA